MEKNKEPPKKTNSWARDRKPILGIIEPPKFDTEEKRKQQEKDWIEVLNREHGIPKYKTQKVIRMWKRIMKHDIIKYGVVIRLHRAMSFLPKIFKGDEKKLENFNKRINKRKDDRTSNK